MFIELMPLLAGRTVLITVAKVDDKTLRVNLIPHPKAGTDEDLGLRARIIATCCAQRTAEPQTGLEDETRSLVRVPSVLIH